MKLTRQERREFVKLVKNARYCNIRNSVREYKGGICYALGVILYQEFTIEKYFKAAGEMELKLKEICKDYAFLPRAVWANGVEDSDNPVKIRNQWLYHWAEAGEYLTVDRWKDRISVKKKLKREVI